MEALIAKGNKATIKKLLILKKESQQEGQYRVSNRLHAVILSIDGYAPGNITKILKANRTSIPEWIGKWNKYGLKGLLEGHRSGREPELSIDDKKILHDIIESGPIAYGLNTGVWTSPIITDVIEEEFDIKYHPGHVRKILKKIGISFQQPTYKLANADPVKKNKWIRYTFPNLKKTPKKKMR